MSDQDPEPDVVEEIAELIAAADRAHREAFVDAGGPDPEWPLWYAETLVADLNRLLGAHMTKSELCYLLVTADREQRASAPGVDWHVWYACFFANRYLG